jgi:hypothetical protein
MSNRFMQDAPPAQSPPPEVFKVDLSGLGTSIWQAFMDHLGEIGTATWQGIRDHMGEIGTAIWTAFSQWLYSGMRAMFLGIWNATLLSIPHDVTDQFAPVKAMMPDTAVIAAAGLALALALLGLRTWVRGITGRGGILDELLGRIMVYVCVLSMLPWIISHAIDTEQTLARSVAMADLVGIMPEMVSPSLGTGIALVLMILLGLRLWLKLSSNVVHVAVAIIWSPVALVCGLIPESSWVMSLWIREFVGRLAGAVLATAATGLGLGLALAHTGDDFVIFGVAGAFLAAHDLVDWLARTPGTGMGGVIGAGMRLAGMMGGGGGAAVSAGAQQAALRSLARSDAARAEQAFYSYD